MRKYIKDGKELKHTIARGVKKEQVLQQEGKCMVEGDKFYVVENVLYHPEKQGVEVEHE